MGAESFYASQIALLACICALVGFYERRRRAIGAATADSSHLALTTEGNTLRKRYLTVYCLVMGADWLQGPYLYSLYREQHGLPEESVALLFVIGFCSGGATAPFVGRFADERGRRLTCLLFCVVYGLSCGCALFPWFPTLFIGRCLGGLATSILFSAFESWLVSSAHAQGVPTEQLSTIFGTATLANGIVATIAGIFANGLVYVSGHFGAPFVASAVVLGVASVVIRQGWSENYGTSGEAVREPIKRNSLGLGKAWRAVISDPILLAVALTSTCYEVAMYVFVFLWVPLLQAATTLDAALPFGIIFSAFMVAMMLGSLLYSVTCTYQTEGSAALAHAKIAGIVCLTAAIALALAARVDAEHSRFYCFCLFEASVGAYFPTLGMLRGELLPEDCRATLTAIFRVPLNAAVAVLLLTGATSERTGVLMASIGLLVLGSLSISAVVVRRLSTEGSTLLPESAEYRLVTNSAL